MFDWIAAFFHWAKDFSLAASSPVWGGVIYLLLKMKNNDSKKTNDEFVENLRVQVDALKVILSEGADRIDNILDLQTNKLLQTTSATDQLNDNLVRTKIAAQSATHEFQGIAKGVQAILVKVVKRFEAGEARAWRHESDIKTHEDKIKVHDDEITKLGKVILKDNKGVKND